MCSTRSITATYPLVCGVPPYDGHEALRLYVSISGLQAIGWRFLVNLQLPWKGAGQSAFLQLTVTCNCVVRRITWWQMWQSCRRQHFARQDTPHKIPRCHDPNPGHHRPSPPLLLQNRSLGPDSFENKCVATKIASLSGNSEPVFSAYAAAGYAPGRVAMKSPDIMGKPKLWERIIEPRGVSSSRGFHAVPGPSPSGLKSWCWLRIAGLCCWSPPKAFHFQREMGADAQIM